MLRDESVSASIPKADIICPIEAEIFFEPAMTDCEHHHIFEKFAIEKWVGQHHNCPECREAVTHISRPPVQFTNMLDNILDKNPALQNDRFFYLGYLEEALRSNDAPRLERIIRFLKASDHSLSKIHDDDKYNKMCAAHLLMQYTPGRECVIKNPDLINKITAEALNMRLVDGDSLLSWLCVTKIGTKILADNKALRTMISPDTFNLPDDTRDTPVYRLVFNDDEGINLICSDPVLRNKINETGLNKPGKSGENPDYRNSALAVLAGNANGRRTLINDSVLRGKATLEGLSTVDSDVSWLMLDARGREMLRQHAELRAKITLEGMNEIREEDNASLLFHFLSHHEGQETLEHDKTLRDKINSQGLNTVSRGHHTAGESAVYELCKHHIGRKILKNDARIRNLISAEALNSPAVKDDNKSAAYWLLNTEDGNAILKMDPEMNGKIRRPAVENQLETTGATNSSTLFARPDTRQTRDSPGLAPQAHP